MDAGFACVLLDLNALPQAGAVLHSQETFNILLSLTFMDWLLTGKVCLPNETLHLIWMGKMGKRWGKSAIAIAYR